MFLQNAEISLQGRSMFHICMTIVDLETLIQEVRAAANGTAGDQMATIRMWEYDDALNSRAPSRTREAYYSPAGTFTVRLNDVVAIKTYKPFQILQEENYDDSQTSLNEPQAIPPTAPAEFPETDTAYRTPRPQSQVVSWPYQAAVPSHSPRSDRSTGGSYEVGSGEIRAV